MSYIVRNFFLVVALHLSHIQPITAAECRSLIILLDPLGQETPATGNKAMALNLATALYEKAAPIIATTNLLYNFCFWKTTYRAELYAAAHALRDAASPQMAIQDTRTSYDTAMRKHREHKDLFTPDFFILLNFTNLDQGDWTIYHHKRANLVLLIPHAYLRHNRCSLEQSSFRFDDLDRLSDLSPEHLDRTMKRHIPHPISCVPALASMLAPKSATSQPTWNIFISGHGSTARKEGNALVFGTIAGLPSPEFIALLRFLNCSINTSLIYYTTCFGGGANQLLVSESLKKLAVRCIVVAEGVTESSTLASYKTNFVYDPYPNVRFKLQERYGPFFEALQKFFCDPTTFAAQRRGQRGDPLAHSLKKLAFPNCWDNNQIFVRFPIAGASIFRAIRVDERVKILTKTRARACAFEGTPIDAQNGDLECLLIVYPYAIQAPLLLGRNTALVAPTPRIFKQLLPRPVYVFDEIRFNSSPRQLTCLCLLRNAGHFPITFLIKRLTCFDYKDSGLGAGDKQPLVLKHVIIHITGSTTPQGDFAAHAKVTFMLDETTYQMSVYAPSVKQRTDVIQACKTLKPALATPLYMQELYRTVLPSSSPPNTPLPQALLQQLFAALTEQAPQDAIQQPGSLKAVLETQQTEQATGEWQRKRLLRDLHMVKTALEKLGERIKKLVGSLSS